MASREAEFASEDAALRLVPAFVEDAERLASMALDIWHRHYFPDILSRPEIDYLWNRMYRPEALREQMDAGSVFRWIERLQTPVGFFAYHMEAASARLRLTKLYVLPEYHGKGIGRFALSAVKQTAMALGAREIYLYVFRKNVRAVRAYQRAGFHILREDYSDAGSGFFYDDYVMALPLGSDDGPHASNG